MVRSSRSVRCAAFGRLRRREGWKMATHSPCCFGLWSSPMILSCHHCLHFSTMDSVAGASAILPICLDLRGRIANVAARLRYLL